MIAHIAESATYGPPAGVAAGSVGIMANSFNLNGHWLVVYTGELCSYGNPVSCPTGQLGGGSSGTVTPKITGISPSRGLIGASTDVMIMGRGFGTSPTVNAGSSITVTVNSSGDTSISATFSVASNAPSGNHSVTVTAGGQTSSSVNFYVQVPTSLRLVSTTSQGPASCGSGCGGWDRRVIWQVLDQGGQAINQSMSVSDTISIGIPNTCGASTITGSATTDGTGQFSDHYYLCSTGCVGGTCQTDAGQTYTINGTSLNSDIISLVYTCTTITLTGQ